MRKFLIATTNPAKFAEARSVLEDGHFEILGLSDFFDVKKVEETGATFEENAILKAKGYFEQVGIPCIGDDGGLEVEYLGGAPGVASARWLGENASDEDLANAIIKKMKGVPRENRGARLGGCMVFYDGTNLLKKENWLDGYIAEKLMGEVKRGFPYRPILMIPEFNKPYSELTHEEHEQVNFRRKNLKALKSEILKLLDTGKES
ncbi:MAG: non-canonical purine NTP pyrophosphatase [bacterium]|nr:non-canonical purine NTP pyrophosphatase [bacterium]